MEHSRYGIVKIDSQVICNIEYKNDPTVPFISPEWYSCIIPYPSTDPNDAYRVWLEEHVGKQFRDWNWRLHPDSFDKIEVVFKDAEHATLFNLRW